MWGAVGTDIQDLHTSACNSACPRWSVCGPLPHPCPNAHVEEVGRCLEEVKLVYEEGDVDDHPGSLQDNISQHGAITQGPRRCK